MSTPIDPLLALKEGQETRDRSARELKTHDYLDTLADQLRPLFPSACLPQDLGDWPRDYDKCEAWIEVGRVRFGCYDKGLAFDESGSRYSFSIAFHKLRRFLFWRWVSKATIKGTHITAEMAVYALGCQRAAERYEGEVA